MLKSKKITIGGNGITRKLEIGGNAPISIQSMWKESLLKSDLKDIVLRLEKLQALGCDIVRFAVPEMESAELLVKLSYLTSMPLVADIHFDHRLALLCMEGNVAKIRINPGNIGSEKNVVEVVKKALDKGVALRIGVNSGSLPKDLAKKLKDAKTSTTDDFLDLKANLMAEAAFRELEILDRLNFNTALVSIKASGVKETIFANKAFRAKRNEPLHLGVTEAGPLVSGIVKSSIAFNKLLEEGIGDTIRVSLSDTMENEVLAAREILSECGKRENSLKLVSCPRCGRRGFDVHSFVSRWQHRLFAIKKDVTVAIMGCVVNGPGEASMADLGITGSPEMVVIFKKGVPIHTIKLNDVSKEMRETIIDEAFEKELNEL